MDNLGREVGRAIVDDEDFIIASGEVLLKNANNCLLDKTLMVIGVDQNTDERARPGVIIFSQASGPCLLAHSNSMSHRAADVEQMKPGGDNPPL
jgi:hypothetical protein